MKNRAAIESLIDRLVSVDYFDERPPLDFKIALLSLVLEELKHERQMPEDVVDFETYMQSEILADQNKISITKAVFEKDLGTGTASIRLQPPLLLFLLSHRSQTRVLDIVQQFVEKVRPQLTYLDFKKTKSGWARCFTNTRQAALVLHNHGLLRFTWRDGYKSWDLSLGGYLAAAEIFHQRSRELVPWSIPPHFREFNFEVRPEIRRAWDDISNYDAFIGRLKSMCQLNTTVFNTFEPALRKAYPLLQEYWVVMNDVRLSRKDRRAASSARMRELEREAISDEFYDEFSKCIQVEEPSAKSPSHLPTDEKAHEQAG
jgi:hypothetical protein